MSDDAYAQITADIGQAAVSILAGTPIDRARARRLCDAEGDALYDLFYWANRLRVRFVGRAVRCCSILAAKVGACSEDCAYCAQSAHFRTQVQPQRRTPSEMFAAAEEALAHGASSFGIVNSGRGPTRRELDWLEPFLRRTAGSGRIRTCATLGELTPDQARRLRDMGVQRVNHNLETSRRHFPRVVSTHGYEDRLRTIRIAREAGLSICSGGIFGLGEGWEDRLDMAFELRELGADVVPINFLHAIAGTPLHRQLEPLEPLEALKIIAIFRFILPDRELKVAGGREKILRDLQSWMFFAGGSSFLIGNYLTTSGRPAEQDHQMLRDLGLPLLTYAEVEHEAAMPPAGGVAAPRAVALPVLR